MNKLSKSLVFFWIGIGALGVAIGYFVGLSQSPVIATLLPLLFGLIGGSSGFLISRIKTDQPDSADTVKYSGIAFTVFSVTIIFSSFLALYIKNDAGQINTKTELILKDANPQLATKLIAIRKQLEILGATEKEQLQILQLALQTRLITASNRAEITQYLNVLSNRSKITAQTIQTALSQKDLQLEEDVKSNLKSLALILRAIPPIFQHWVESISGKGFIPEAAIKKKISTLSYNLSELVGSQNNTNLETISNLSANPTLLQNLLVLQSALVINVPRWESKKILNLHNIDFEVDRLTTLLLTQKNTNGTNLSSFGFAYNEPLPSNSFNFGPSPRG